MKKMLFVGGFFPTKDMDEIKQKSIGPIQYAANSLQWKMLDGFDQTFHGVVETVTCPFVGGYPKHYRDILFKGKQFSRKSGTNDTELSFLNIMGLSTLSLYNVNKRFIKKWINENTGNECYVVFYSLQIQYLKLAKYLSDYYKHVHLHVIVPDLPNFMELGKSKYSVYSFIKKYHNYICKKNIKYFNSYTLLTEAMANYLNITNEKYALVEGIASENVDAGRKILGNFNIVYTGTLTRKYGVMDLINAFHIIKNQSFRLIICGSGETEREIMEASKKDSRIKFMGLVDSRKIKDIQLNASILVNPRKNNEIYTKYSFPSKLMEYLSMGKPVLCYKLDGIPNEYDKYLNYIEDESLEKFSRKIEEMFELGSESLEKIGISGREFVSNNKNAVEQTKKIVRIICGDEV